ncbi:hypothetical protein XELAEV_18034918mg [Xenopus laevis]|uniref:Uncharacterized protein n=1 Tax=Xenopus laevis TaxID=8355 RepID=A0A974HBY9_XENLA|nr:hypothetical protein XELAEV_18034918mg [Xenopus laevis]
MFTFLYLNFNFAGIFSHYLLYLDAASILILLSIQCESSNQEAVFFFLSKACLAEHIFFLYLLGLGV